MKIENSVVLVTGANRGLGRALVEALLEAGARKVYAGARDPQTLGALAAGAPSRVVPLALDITDDASLAAAAERAQDLELLVNNAGVLASFNALTSSAAAIGQDFATNVFGTLAATRAFLPALERSAKQGRKAAVVNVLSVVSLASMPALGAYSASKAAAYSLTQAVRADLAPRGVQVFAALPGAIDTDMIRTFEMPKTSPTTVARGILEGIEADAEEITPDPMSREIFAKWVASPKALERHFADNAG